jgi:Na+-driven multidrug efflux pump
MVVTATAALVFIPAWGTTGAAFASTLGYAVGGALAWIFFARLGGEEALGTPSRQGDERKEQAEQ